MREPAGPAVEIGRVNRLRVVSRADHGIYVDGYERGNILVPRRYVPDGCAVGDLLDVFVYPDSENRLIAVTETPKAQAGELAYLEVVDVTKVGAFLGWGLPKDLLVPFREQKQRMVRGRRYIVQVYFDAASERLVASGKVHKFVGRRNIVYAPGTEVELILCDPFDLGFNVIIDRRCVGVVYHSEIFRPLEPGEETRGYIKDIRPDGKIDVELQRSEDYFRRKTALSDDILRRLSEGGGFLSVSDKSPPALIYEMFGVSKKVFKKAIGGLYRNKAIAIEDKGIRLTDG